MEILTNQIICENSYKFFTDSTFIKKTYNHLNGLINKSIIHVDQKKINYTWLTDSLKKRKWNNKKLKEPKKEIEIIKEK